MNKFLLLLSVTAALTACSNSPAGSSNAGATDSTATSQTAPAYKVYGDTITTDGAIAMADFEKAMAGKDSLDGKVNCEITASCAKKGCWMDVRMTDGTPMKVHFKDYAFFVPTSGLEGKEAVIQGRAIKEVTDAATLRHYAEDAGKSKEECDRITADETSWSFMADGVLIKD